MLERLQSLELLHVRLIRRDGGLVCVVGANSVIDELLRNGIILH